MTAVHCRTGFDCGVTALAVLITDIVMQQVDPEMRGLKSLYSRELIDAAKLAGITLRATKCTLQNATMLDHAKGILRIRWNRDEDIEIAPNGHFVTVLGGSIHCGTQHVVMPWRDYLIKFDGRPCSLLRLLRKRGR